MAFTFTVQDFNNLLTVLDRIDGNLDKLDARGPQRLLPPGPFRSPCRGSESLRVQSWNHGNAVTLSCSRWGCRLRQIT